MDGRFIKRTIDWVSDKTGGVFDFRTEVGSSKIILDSEPDRERFFNLVDCSISLHNIKEIWLIDHIDCGAYGGSKQFPNESEEKEFHIERLNQAQEIVIEKYPDLKVKKVYVGWETIEVIK